MEKGREGTYYIHNNTPFRDVGLEAPANYDHDLVEAGIDMDYEKEHVADEMDAPATRRNFKDIASKMKKGLNGQQADAFNTIMSTVQPGDQPDTQLDAQPAQPENKLFFVTG